ncbi:MAG: nitroreductase family protein [bacterium]
MSPRLMDTIRERRSIRRYTEEPLTPEQEQALVESARWAPSSGNLQARKFHFIIDRALREALVQTCFDHAWMIQAPLLVVGSVDERITEEYGEAGLTTFGVMDLSASVQNMLLAAHDLGLGACWVCAFPPGKVKEILELPDRLHPLIMVTVGTPAEEPERPSRLDPGEVAEFIR